MTKQKKQVKSWKGWLLLMDGRPIDISLGKIYHSNATKIPSEIIPVIITMAK